jgi:hypothetical protein
MLPNAKKLNYGDQWVSGVPSNKNFSLSFLYSRGAGADLNGYNFRQVIWEKKQERKIPTFFWTSIAGLRKPLVPDLEPYPFENKDNLFESIQSQHQIKHWRKRNYLENAPQFIKEKVLEKYSIENANWVETGTYVGDTTYYLSKKYPHIYSIEPNVKFYKAALNIFKGLNVTLFNNVSENIINFWNINHTGVGGIVSSNQKFHITPRNAEISTIFVSPTGTPDGDGLSLATATTHAKAFIYLSTISSRGLDGNWRIRYSAGFYNSEGVRIQQNLPIFKNRLQIIGEPVNTTENEIPKTIFTGDQSILGYWIHCENNVNFLRLHFKDIKVQNYKSGVSLYGMHTMF